MSGPQVRPAVYVSAWFINLGAQHEKHPETFKHHDALARLKPDATFSILVQHSHPLPPSRPLGFCGFVCCRSMWRLRIARGVKLAPRSQTWESRPSFSLPQTRILTIFSYSFGHSATLRVYRFELIPPALSPRSYRDAF